MLDRGFGDHDSRCAGTACVFGLLAYGVYLFIGGGWWSGVD